MSSLYEQIVATYPDLENSIQFTNGTIILQDDSDGQGAFIAKWDYASPLPNGLVIGKANAKSKTKLG